MTDVKPTKPRHPKVYDVEREGYDRNMDFAMQMRERRSLFSYMFFDYPIGVVRFSYFRSRYNANTRLFIVPDWSH